MDPALKVFCALILVLGTNSKRVPQESMDHCESLYSLSLKPHFYEFGTHFPDEPAFRTNQFFPDACFPCTWTIDLHTPDPAFDKGHEGAEFISKANFGKYQSPYWAPYRCLYSRNVSNLFMAGRDISVTHEALGPVRVMRTCGCMGEVVGMAASLCKQHDCNPRAVYQQHLGELKQLMTRGVGKQAGQPVP